ncbi:HAD family hydrolase [Pectinatus brassicae]|uniref:Phosphoglycolate phosphatase n=1 Tax=Pectinatus brassicae TaxID=862415 RepID=A0A840UKV9_9FIRM|nr:HAD family hydrolase [Pectinatus brassicae]MBB5335348.1 phosphoglycolate phosphatase [Pectinatus brassicae]
MQYKAVIFDLDGTLINSLEDLADSANAVMREYNFPTYSLDDYRMKIGNGVKKLIERAVPSGTSEETTAAVLARYREVYKQNNIKKTAPYAGIKQMLADLQQKNIPVAICTNKPDADAKNIVNILFPDVEFVEVIGDLPGFKPKPDPKKVLMIAEKMQLQPQEIAYVGDSSVDMQTGVNAAMLPVGVTWGFRDEEELIANGGQVIINKPAELLDKVDFINQ